MGAQFSFSKRRDDENRRLPLPPLQQINASVGDAAEAGNFGYHTPFKDGNGTILSAMGPGGKRVPFVNGQAPELAALNRQQAGGAGQPLVLGRVGGGSARGNSVNPSTAAVNLAAAPSAADRFDSPGPGGSVGPSSASVVLKQAPSVADRFAGAPPTGSSGPGMFTDLNAPVRLAGTPEAAADTMRQVRSFAGLNTPAAAVPAMSDPSRPGSEVSRTTDAGGTTTVKTLGGGTVNIPASQPQTAPAGGGTGIFAGGVEMAKDAKGNFVPAAKQPPSYDEQRAQIKQLYPQVFQASSDANKQFVAAFKAGGNNQGGALDLAHSLFRNPATDRPGVSSTLAGILNPAAGDSTAYNPSFKPPMLQPGTADNSNYTPAAGPATAPAPLPSAGTRAATAVQGAGSAVKGGVASFFSGIGQGLDSASRNVGDFVSAFTPENAASYAPSGNPEASYASPAIAPPAVASAAVARPPSPAATPTPPASASIDPTPRPGRPLIQGATLPLATPTPPAPALPPPSGIPAAAPLGRVGSPVSGMLTASLPPAPATSPIPAPPATSAKAPDIMDSFAAFAPKLAPTPGVSLSNSGGVEGEAARKKRLMFAGI